MRLAQGTVSVLLGCHSPIHAVMVAKAWRKLYGRWPRPWEAACIALHDIGHLGLDYLDDPEAKAEHWRLGALTAWYLFGSKGWALCAGHSRHSGEPESMLYRADKLARAITPDWQLYLEATVEPALRKGRTVRGQVEWFKRAMAASRAAGFKRSTHDLWMDS